MRSSRRSFLHQLSLTAAALSPAARPLLAHAQPSTVDQTWHTTWSAALAVLAGNVKTTPHFDKPILFEGSTYQGAWQECGPHESLAYAQLARFVAPREDKLTPLDIARNTHRAFFANQREDGQLPASVKLSEAGFAQIQMVVPIAATAWDLSQLLHDEAFLTEAYNACSRWDAWLRRYRNTRGTGLVEAFCIYDTGQDNSPRWNGVPKRCADNDARKSAVAPGMPRLCPDLSATVFGARIALAHMADALGKHAEAARWREDAETLRRLILAKLWCEEDASFYDLDTENKFVRVRSVANLRVLGEHVLDTKIAHDRSLFDQLWTRQLSNPKAYWTTFPFPSIAADDPKFVRPIPRNSWGGATQALTALRTLRWMDHYGKHAEQRYLMQQWTAAIMRHGEFRQQIDPLTGTFTQPDPGGYSPCALVFLKFAEAMRKAPKA
ncbi:MAG: trehalase family glycosidase [Acidobacteriaceae bacterium]|nr:trehalase family glycosidase [Acidobacteriaceae bacterium]